MLPEILYRLQFADDQVRWLDPILRNPVQQLANVFVFTSITVPIDKAILLSHASNRAAPGAAQFITDAHLFLQSPDNVVTVTLKRDDTDRAANFAIDQDWQGEIVVPPLWQIVAANTFNAGAAVNTTRLHVVGIQIPRGNIERA